MQFRTQIEIPASPITIAHSDSLLFIGSCFSQNIGERMRQRLFDVLVNPFGTTYNPASIAHQVEVLASHRQYTATDLFFNDGRWHCFDFHSSFSSASQEVAIENINASLAAARSHLAKCKVVVVTLGTAWVYRLKEQGIVVANCHKLPASNFERTRLSVPEAVSALESIVEHLKALAPMAQVIMTVSPIRHVADGLAGNNVSKSVLRVAIDEVLHHGVEYFPSYEIMLDDLRDYRFYNADMTHPSDVAVDYIYNHFVTSHCSPATIATSDQCRRFTQLVAHRPMSDNPADIVRLQESIKNKAKALVAQYPYLNTRLTPYIL